MIQPKIGLVIGSFDPEVVAVLPAPGGDFLIVAAPHANRSLPSFLDSLETELLEESL